MNKGIFYATILRLKRPSGLISLFIAAIVVPIWIGVQCSSETTQSLIRPVLLGPMIPMIVAYTLIKSEIGNTKSLNDGEYLSLVFTRPISRASYVLSKWFLCSLFVSAVVVVQQAIFTATLAALGQPNVLATNAYTYANVICNSFGVTAVIVLINSMPPKIGIFAFLVVTYGTMLGSMFSEVALTSERSGFGHMILSGILESCQFVRTFCTPSLDTFEIFTGVKFDPFPIIVYLSNVCTYLSLAVIILSRREFFYASE